MNFLDRALPLVARGIAVIPVTSFGKDPDLRFNPHAAKGATTDLKKIALWNQLGPTMNVGCVGTPKTVVIFDEDLTGLLERVEAEIGPLPETLTIRTAGKGLSHLYYRQTDVSRELGNRSRAGMFDLRSVNTYVVGPGSELETGTGVRTYEIAKDLEIADFPPALADWIRKQPSTTGSSKDGDQDALDILINRYLENLDPEEMFGVEGLVFSDNHNTLKTITSYLIDGERSYDEIANIVDRLKEEYGHSYSGKDSDRLLKVKEKEAADLAEWFEKRNARPIRDKYGMPLEPRNLSIPSFIDGRCVADTQEALDALIDAREGRRYREAQARVEVASGWFFKAGDLLAEKLPEQRIYMHTKEGTPVLRSNFLTELFAYRGIGKSAVAMGLVKILSEGGEFLDYTSAGGAKVLYADGELPLCLLQDRIKTFIGHQPENLWVMSAERLPNQQFPALIDPKVQAAFESRLEELKPDVVVLDTLTAIGKFDTNDPDAWRIFNDFLLRLRFKGYCVLIIHHAGKNGTQRGRTDAEDNMDLVIHLEAPEGHDSGDGLKANVTYKKVRYGGRLKNFSCAYANGEWKTLADTFEKDVIEQLNDGHSIRDIMKLLNLKKNQVEKIQRRAKENGLLLSAKELRQRAKEHKEERRKEAEAVQDISTADEDRLVRKIIATVKNVTSVDSRTQP